MKDDLEKLFDMLHLSCIHYKNTTLSILIQILTRVINKISLPEHQIYLITSPMFLIMIFLTSLFNCLLL